MADSFYTDAVPCPSRDSINTGLSSAQHSTMVLTFGVPGRLTVDCSDLTNQKLLKLIETRRVGPFKSLTGLKPALDALDTVFRDVDKDMPGLYAVLGTAGMLCCRSVRGRPEYYSNHSWGTAIDLKVGGILAPLNATRIPRGLLLIYPYLHRNGWFWAAGYQKRTDPMHFEVSQETIQKWKASGMLPGL